MLFKKRLCKICSKPAMQNRAVCYACDREAKRKKREDNLAKQAVSKQKKKAVKQAKSALSIANMDKLWRLALKAYYGPNCAKCGRTPEQWQIDNHHIIGRTNHGVRWDYRNGIRLCASCHTLSAEWSAHQTPIEFGDWIREKRGEKWYQDLRARSWGLKADRKKYREELEVIANGIVNLD